MNFSDCFLVGGSDDRRNRREREAVHNFIRCCGHGVLSSNNLKY